MNFDDTMDPHNKVGINRVMHELEQHGYDSMFVAIPSKIPQGDLHIAPMGSDSWERVCIVYKNMVRTRTLMLWLGY